MLAWSDWCSWYEERDGAAKKRRNAVVKTTPRTVAEAARAYRDARFRADAADIAYETDSGGTYEEYITTGHAADAAYVALMDAVEALYGAYEEERGGGPCDR